MSDNIQTQVEKINRLYKAQDEIYHNLAVRFGLSDAALWTLYSVCASKTPRTQYDLVCEWYIPKQTVNSAISGLEKAGYVRLEPMPGTRNRKNVVLTEAGQRFCSRTVFPLLEAESRVLAHFRADEREVFIALLEREIPYLKEETDGIGKI